jgi:hypothetical protein
MDFFKFQTGPLGSEVTQLIDRNLAAITGVVIAELLQGLKTETESKRLERLLHSIHYLKTEERDWINAGQLSQQLRTKGVTLPLTDILIATIAQRHAVSILTIDKHFQHLPVSLYKWSP